MLIPGALEGQINAETVKQVSSRVRLVAEGANGPTTPEADEVFKSNNVFVIPDFLCNAGGVTVSYFESVQNDMNFYWTTRRGAAAPGYQDDPGLQQRAGDVREAKRSTCAMRPTWSPSTAWSRPWSCAAGFNELARLIL